ncbi:hypothetical protein FACS189483_00910 [Spirochaetia bacterium]|nr:hypothetical protein FACS189483_00910 [Spirochaetia bacterium]
MKYNVIIIIILLLSSCSKKDTGDIIKNNNISSNINNQENIIDEQIINESAEEYNKFMYVNSQEGLKVRASPDINAEKIYLLKDNQEVRVIEIDTSKITIDGIEGYWILIETDEINGYVFNGYLTEKAAISPEYNIVYNQKGTIESIVLPDGRVVSRDTIIDNDYSYKIDTIKLYYTQSIESAYKKIIDKNVTFFEDRNDDEWLYLITEDLESYGFIKIKDISENSFYGDVTKNSSSGNYYSQRLNREYSITKTNQNIKRYGPLLIINSGGKIKKFWDSLAGRGQRYLLIDIFDNTDLLFFVQYYEGISYFIYNIEYDTVIGALMGEPLFNENKNAFVSFGSFYSELPKFVLYSINKNEYKKEKEADNIYTLLDIKWDTYAKYEISWVNNTKLEIKFENIGSYIIYYENNEWQEKIVKY